MARTLSTAEAARVLGMSESRIRQLVRSGLGRPARRGRRYAFSFQDLVVLRTAHALIEARVPAARVARALAALTEALPPDRPLSGLRVRADGRSVAVRDGTQSWDPETGQTLLEFGVDDLAARAERLAASKPAATLPGDGRERARHEFERALELEDEDPVEACSAYGRALELDPELVDAYVNLGRIAHEAGRGKEATRLYELALERAPDDPLIHFNLALALEDTRGPAAGVRHYERALALDADFADAHYNLARLCEKLGRDRDAIRHYNAYRRLTEPD